MNIKILRQGNLKKAGDGIFRYWGWPTVGRLPDGTLVAVCSGMRTAHVDPFGKLIAFYSKDEGESFSPPTVLSSTPLDDRDGGMLSLRDGRVLYTSFNNSVAYQKKAAERRFKGTPRHDLVTAYLAEVTKEEEKKYNASYYKISPDGYRVGEEIIKVPVSSPHGPIQLSDDRIFYAGGVFHTAEELKPEPQVGYIISEDGIHWSDMVLFDTEQYPNLLFCEPHSIQLSDGTVLVLFRTEQKGVGAGSMELYETHSHDGCRTFSPLKKVEDLRHGGPPHLMMHSSGVLVCAYGYRQKPYGERVMLSRDGVHWETDFILRDDGENWDLGYPSSVELRDGSILTLYYHGRNNGGSDLDYTVWKLEP